MKIIFIFLKSNCVVDQNVSICYIDTSIYAKVYAKHFHYFLGYTKICANRGDAQKNCTNERVLLCVQKFI